LLLWRDDHPLGYWWIATLGLPFLIFSFVAYDNQGTSGFMPHICRDVIGKVYPLGLSDGNASLVDAILFTVIVALLLVLLTVFHRSASWRKTRHLYAGK
jgi:hypothetical protein